MGFLLFYFFVCDNSDGGLLMGYKYVHYGDDDVAGGLGDDYLPALSGDH